MYDRRGSLFLDNLNRKPVTNSTYYNRLIRYIYLSPVTHGFVDQPQDWDHSLYQSLLSKQATLLCREEVLDWFGGREELIQVICKHKKTEGLETFGVYKNYINSHNAERGWDLRATFRVLLHADPGTLFYLQNPQ